MRLPLLAMLLVGILAGAAPRSVAAQDCSSATRRPRLDSSRDTNNAGAYYYYGLSQLPKYPKRAAEAFCWAERLDPSWALPLYGRWTALLLNQPSWRLLAYLGGDESVVHSPEILRIDSLKYRALLRDPLLYERLDELLYREVIANLTAGELTLYDIGGSSAQGRAWMAYGRGDFALALSEYARAIHAKPDNFALHGARARVFYLTLQFDSSRVEFETMLAGFRNRRKDKIVYVYQSEALTLFAIGKTYEAEGNLDSARAAYGQALVEDLSFYSAHAAYGRLAFARGDTATAASEYGLAVELAGDDAALRHRYGLVLIAAGLSAQAAEQFSQAIATAPDCADPYFPLAYLQDQSGFNREAMTNYEAFLRRAPQAMDGQIRAARARLALLRAASPGPAPQ